MMRSSILLAFPVPLVVLGMCTSPFDAQRTGPVRDSRLKTVRIAFHVKNHHPASQEARRGVALADVLRCRPCGGFDVGQPVLDPIARVGMLAAELLQPFPVENPHPYPGTRHSTTYFPFWELPAPS